MSRSRFVSQVLVICVLVSLISAGLAAAQLETLEYGETAYGTVDDNSPEPAYAFEARAGDVVTIALTATSGDLDTLLVLADGAGNFITQDDDSGEGRNSLIQDFVIPADDTYRVIATRYDRVAGDTSGEYMLTLTARPAGGEAAETPTEVPSGVSGEAPAAEVPAGADVFGELPDLGGFTYTVLTHGDIAAGTIDDATPALPYVFGGHAGEEVTLEVSRTSGDLSLDVALFDRTGVGFLAGVEDTEAAGAVTLTHTLPETTYYVVGVRRSGGQYGDTSGDYTLAFSVAGVGAPTVVPAEQPPAGQPPAIDIILSWNTTADLDLVLYYPAEGQAASIDWHNAFDPATYPLPEGATLSGDEGGFCPATDQPVERITWAADKAPLGGYEILVIYWFPCGSAAPAEFELTYTVDGETQTVVGSLAGLLEEYRVTFAR